MKCKIFFFNFGFLCLTTSKKVYFSFLFTKRINEKKNNLQELKIERDKAILVFDESSQYLKAKQDAVSLKFF